MSNHRTKMVCGSFHSEAACLEEGGSMSIRFVKSHIGVCIKATSMVSIRDA
jgi:hypothetical protein